MAAFEPQTVSMLAWRAVEAQHRVATMVLARSLEEQALLEQILDASKPPLPAGAEQLHWLLFTPFRYPPLPSGSRFRGASDPGVLYAAELPRTACAELGYWRWRFLCDSSLERIGPVGQSVFAMRLSGPAVDLRAPPFLRRRKRWIDPSDYGHCQAMARQVRAQGVQLLCYESVRDPQHGGCVAVLDHRAFADPVPVQHQRWRLLVSRQRVLWQEDSINGGSSFEFDTAAWAGQA